MASSRTARHKSPALMSAFMLVGGPKNVPLMLEHLKTAEEYEEGKRYIQKVASGIGVAFA